MTVYLLNLPRFLQLWQMLLLASLSQSIWAPTSSRRKKGYGGFSQYMCLTNKLSSKLCDLRYIA